MEKLKLFFSLTLKKPIYKDWVLYLFIFGLLSTLTIPVFGALFSLIFFLWLPSKIRSLISWALTANKPEAKAKVREKYEADKIERVKKRAHQGVLRDLEEVERANKLKREKELRDLEKVERANKLKREKELRDLAKTPIQIESERRKQEANDARIARRQAKAALEAAPKTASNPGFKVGALRANNNTFLLNCSHTLYAGGFGDLTRVNSRVYCSVCKDERRVTRKLGTGESGSRDGIFS